MAKILKAETIETDLLGSNGNNALSLQRNSSSLLTLNTSDNVGIGTTVPTSKLEVKGNIDAGGVFRVNLTNASAALFEAGLISVKNSSSNQTLDAENSYMSFSLSSVGSTIERMRITSNGGIAFGGATNYGTSAHVLKSSGDAAPVWGFITNDNVDSAAAISYSKLNLASGITSSDIVNNTIVNANINSSAAIAYSKLNLSNSIVSGDIFSGSITTDKIADGAITTFPLASTVRISAVVAPLLPLASLIVPSGEDGTERVKFWVAVADWPI